MRRVYLVITEREIGRVVFSAERSIAALSGRSDSAVLRAHGYDPERYCLERASQHRTRPILRDASGVLLPNVGNRAALYHDGGYGDAYDAAVMGAAIRATTRPSCLALYMGHDRNDLVSLLRYRSRPIFDVVYTMDGAWHDTVEREKDRWDTFYDWRPYVGRVWTTNEWLDIPGGAVERSAYDAMLSPATNRLQYLGKSVHQLGFESMYLAPVALGDVRAEIPESSAYWEPILRSDYMTVSNGSDAGIGRRLPQTKEWEVEKWARVVAAMPYPVYHVGVDSEEPITGAKSLLGETTIPELLAVLERSRLHLSIENGTVRMARSIGTRSVVVYGSTPSSLYHLEGNVIVESSVCPPCVWQTRDWMWRCSESELDAKRTKICHRVITTEQVIEAALEAVR